MQQARERLSPARRGDRPCLTRHLPTNPSPTATSLYQEITDKIIAELEQGRVPWVQPWGRRQRPARPAEATPPPAATIRGINILILWCAVVERGFTGQNWLTFRQALKLGAHVRKGEKGTTVVYADRFIPYRERTRAAETGDEPASDSVPQALHGVQRRPMRGTSGRHRRRRRRPCTTISILPQAEALIRATGADLRIGGNRAFYVPSADYIQVPPPSAYFEPINWHRTVCHELGPLDAAHASRLEPRYLRRFRLDRRTRAKNWSPK